MTCRSAIAGGFLPAVLLVLAGLVPAAQGRVAERGVDERTLKAVMLYKFAQFATWPAGTFHDATSPFVIGVLGEDPFGNFLDLAVRGRYVDGHPVRVERYTWAGDIRACQLLYVSRSERNLCAALLRDIDDAPILAVSDMEGFLARGGAIQLILLDGHIGFDVNTVASRHGGVHLSSKLLQIAHDVER